MGISHTTDLLYIRITLRTGRPVALKQALYQKIAANISVKTSVGQNDVMIILVENNDGCWSFGDGEAQYLV